MKSEFALICLLLLTALGRTPPTKPNAAMRRAADQILRHQTADGAITQGLPSDAASRIVPYFGNFAALGLVAAYAQTHHRPYLNAARNWIAWYEAHQNANGTIFDYTGTSGAWKPTGDFDSTDSYAATYLELVLAAYRAALRPPGPPILGGEIRIKASLVPPKLGGVGGRNVTKDWLRARHASVRRALAGIRLTLQPCGLTLAKPTYPVMYTMDNVETARGLRAAAQIAQALGDSREAAEAQAMAEKMAAAIARDLWDAARQSYRIGIQPDGGKMEGLEKWYPDVMANLMAIAWLPSPRHAAPYARLKTQFAADIPAAVRSEGDLDHLVWWGLAAQGAGDKELAAQIAARLADFDSSRPAVPNPALLGHICRILAAERAAGTDRAVLRHRAPTRNALPIFGRSLQVDPAFAYYQDRSTDSIEAEVRANGYRIVHYILTADSSVRPDLIAAFHKRGIGVWYLTFGNGTYSTQDLPNGWQEWKMVTRTDLEGKPLSDGYNRLCLNNPDYRAWKKRQITQMLRAHPFQGIDIVEPHWPEYPGAESPEYGCFCAHCLAAFRRQFPEETALPDILHSDSPRSPQRNPALWRKWLAFRQASLTDFLNDLVNGKDGIREAAPQAKVCVWTLALMEPDGLQHVREIHGEDAAEIARVVRPDLHCFQTHWPDWTQAVCRGDPLRRASPAPDDPSGHRLAEAEPPQLGVGQDVRAHLRASWRREHDPLRVFHREVHVYRAAAPGRRP